MTCSTASAAASANVDAVVPATCRHRRRRGLEQQPDLRRHEHHHDAAEPAQRHHQRLPDDHEQRVIQNATSAVASLPALIIQRADPGLYNLLTNGILQARWTSTVRR